MMKEREVVVAKANDWRAGQMQQISIDDSEILLAKIGDKFYATSAYCTHYGAPLAKGVLCEHRVVCPWHNACFDLTNGDLAEPPALDSLPSFPVRIDGDDVIIRVPETIPDSREEAIVKSESDIDSRVFIVIGAGAAGTIAVETLRHNGYQGAIKMISDEEKLPYDRTKLSKAYLQGGADEDSLALRSCEFYDDNDIELLFGKAVTKVDVSQKSISFEDDSTLNYDSLLLATGAKANKLDVSGSDLDNIFTLHVSQDTTEILNKVESAKKAVVIGSSFIGMEAASSLRKQGLEVTVVSPDAVPFAKILGEDVGKMFRQLHEDNGVKFYLENKATEFSGNGKVETVVLDSGDRIETDLVIVGIGVKPVTDYLEGIELNEKDRSVSVNEYLEAAPDVYAAGDIARFPYAATGEPTRIEHWRLAAQHGRIAALNMLDEKIKFTHVPFFWSGQYDLKLRYAGHAEKWDEIIINGDLNAKEFLAFYVKDSKVLAVAGCGRDKDVAAITELMRLEKMPEIKSIRDGVLDWVAKLPA
ncbi:FAD-dependent oxidoreductase [Myxosarcina sp. GI1]|uniref:FAD-dependent oxidoreductase n=1 Tax=Myxosarcina sp. GI1 TaxID=1541065 RepID=UPI000AC189AF|nr:FAD-dependent oxidoreductase [Myxosarcina sp. GI1]